MIDTRKIVDSILSPADTLPAMKKKASSARAAQNWAGELYWRRRISESSPNDLDALREYARVLGQLGYHSRAREILEKGAGLSPAADFGAEITALDANFGRLTPEVEGTGSKDTDNEGISELLERIIKTRKACQADHSSLVKIYISTSAPIFSETDAKSMSSSLGLSDYSYGFIVRGFVHALEELSIDFNIINNPHYIASAKDISSADTVIHIGVCPPERVRLLKGAYNIICCAWEFDRLRQTVEQTNVHPFSDQSEMLNLADEVWLISEHGAAAVAKTVKSPVFAVPAPVLENHVAEPRRARPMLSKSLRLAQKLDDIVWHPLAVLPRNQGRMNAEAESRASSLSEVLSRINLEAGEPPIVITTMFNAHDYRKQIRPMVEAFLQTASKYPNAVLLMKVTSIHAGKVPANSIIYDQLNDPESIIPPLISDRVWMTTQTMSRDQLNVLMDISSYYVSTSHAEGQNLPLIEFMLRGGVPISVDHTAMANYIKSNNSVIIHSEERDFGARLTQRYNLYNIKTNFVSVADVEMAFDQAIVLSDDDYADKSKAALEMVQHGFGTIPFSRSLEGAISRAKIWGEDK